MQGYQDARNNDDRWALIKPHIKSNTVVLDVGSNVGWFEQQMAADKSVLVWSLEGRVEDAKEQASRLNGSKNVVVCQKHLKLTDLLQLNRSCEMFDTVLMLSVLHYFTPSEVPEVLKTLSTMAEQVIIELANPAERHVAHQDWLQRYDGERLLHFLFDSVEVLGEVPASIDRQAKRKIYRCRNYYFDKQHLTAYMGGEYYKRHHLKFFRGRWTLDKKTKLIKGINLSDVLSYNPQWPTRPELYQLAGKEYFELATRKKVSDVRPWNVLITATGLQVIDYSEQIKDDDLPEIKEGAIASHLIKWQNWLDDRRLEP